MFKRVLNYIWATLRYLCALLCWCCCKEEEEKKKNTKSRSHKIVKTTTQVRWGKRVEMYLKCLGKSRYEILDINLKKHYIVPSVSSFENSFDFPRFVFQPYFSPKTKTMMGVVYFGKFTLGPSKISEGFNSVHGGASIGFGTELGLLFLNSVFGEEKVIVTSVQTKYKKPVPIQTISKFCCKFRNKRSDCNQVDCKIVPYDNEGVELVRTTVTFSVGEDIIQDEKISRHAHSEPILRDEFPSAAAKYVQEEIPESYEEMIISVYPECPSKVFKPLHVEQNYFFLSSPKFRFLSGTNKYSHHTHFFFRFWMSVKEKKSVSLIYFGEEAIGDDPRVIHKGAVCSIIDLITVATNYCLTPPKFFSLTTTLQVDNLDQSEREKNVFIRPYQVVRMECSMESFDKIAQNTIQSKVVGKITDLEGKQVYCTTEVTFFSQPMKKK